MASSVLALSTIGALLYLFPTKTFPDRILKHWNVAGLELLQVTKDIFRWKKRENYFIYEQYFYLSSVF